MLTNSKTDIILEGNKDHSTCCFVIGFPWFAVAAAVFFHRGSVQVCDSKIVGQEPQSAAGFFGWQFLLRGDRGKEFDLGSVAVSLKDAPYRADVTAGVTPPMHAQQPSITEMEMLGGESSQSQGTRTSVFQRLNFASAVGKSSTGMLDFYPLEDRNSNVVVIQLISPRK
ncbi:hypothetical protein L6452_44761 [Arctium lappa]|nr:hypothetical protein L6452_44761 [Arctium lappa]